MNMIALLGAAIVGIAKLSKTNRTENDLSVLFFMSMQLPLFAKGRAPRNPRSNPESVQEFRYFTQAIATQRIWLHHKNSQTPTTSCSAGFQPAAPEILSSPHELC
jgi:hypothetical protein